MRLIPAVLLASFAVPVAAAEHARYIVHFSDTVTASAAQQSLRDAVTPQTGKPHHVRTLATGGELVQLTPDEASSLASMPGVVAVEEDLVLQPTAGPDPLWRRQWYMHDPKVGVDAEVAWRYTRGAGAVVAVADATVVVFSTYTAMWALHAVLLRIGEATS